MTDENKPDDMKADDIKPDSDVAEEIKTELSAAVEALKRVAYAGIGAVAVATEATDEVLQGLVKKGEQTSEEAFREMREARARSREKRGEATEVIRTKLDHALNAVKLPSKADVDALNAKVDILTRKLDEVQAARVDAAARKSPPADSGPSSVG